MIGEETRSDLEIDELRQMKTVGALKLGSKLSHFGTENNGNLPLTTGASQMEDNF